MWDKSAADRVDKYLMSGKIYVKGTQAKKSRSDWSIARDFDFSHGYGSCRDLLVEFKLILADRNKISYCSNHGNE